jgi:hypothetical protein
MATALAPDVEEFAEETPSISEKPSAECPYHLGYLGERSSKSQIPDACLLCKDVVGCMMKKIVE